MMLIKRSITALFLCIFELFLKYSESIVTIKDIPGEVNILIEFVLAAKNVNAARAGCASHNAILIPFDQGIYKIVVLQIFSGEHKGKHKKERFAAKN